MSWKPPSKHPGARPMVFVKRRGRSVRFAINCCAGCSRAEPERQEEEHVQAVWRVASAQDRRRLLRCRLTSNFLPNGESTSRSFTLSVQRDPSKVCRTGRVTEACATTVASQKLGSSRSSPVQQKTRAPIARLLTVMVLDVTAPRAIQQAGVEFRLAVTELPGTRFAGAFRCRRCRNPRILYDPHVHLTLQANPLQLYAGRLKGSGHQC